MRVAFLVFLLSLASPALAQGLTLQLVNEASQPVSSLNLFPLDEDGEFIEDNLGGISDDVAPGAKARVRLSSECGPMLAVVMLKDASELRLNLDTCRNRTLVVRD